MRVRQREKGSRKRVQRKEKCRQRTRQAALNSWVRKEREGIQAVETKPNALRKRGGEGDEGECDEQNERMDE